MTHDETPKLSCPFCGFREFEYGMLLHMEQRHPEGESPFVPREDSSAAPNKGHVPDDGKNGMEYAECPIEGCGEVLVTAELDYHVELHAQEEGLDEAVVAGADDTFLATDRSPAVVAVAPAPRAAPQQHRSRHHHRREEREAAAGGGSSSSSSRHRHHGEGADGRPHGSGHSTATSSRRSAIQVWRELLSMPSSSSRRQHQHHGGGAGSASSSSTATPERPGGVELSVSAHQPPPQKQRLGKAELGKYAHEQTMPDWLVAHLRKGGEVKAEGILPVLEQLLEQSASTKYAFLCHSSVQHISKLKREGGFCGYRNIQMMVSYINASQFSGAQHFKNKLPSIFQIQDLIEDAWDKGINAQGRVETGGVRGTRKYIGTPEAQALFCSLDIPCEAQGFKNREPGKSEARLLQEVERYFQSGDFDPEYKVRRTNLPPIYFQHAGHSMTIVGIERLKGGLTNLLVFDPMFRDSSAIVKLVGRDFEHRFPELALKPYRRGNKYLKKYREFEVLRLRPPGAKGMGS